MEKQIEQITGISPDDRSQIMYQAGLDYLGIQARGYEAVADEISRSRTFWSWWRMHWQKRDEAFINSMQESKISNHVALQLYHALHNPVPLSCELSLNGAVLQESYASLMGRLQQECYEPVKTTA